MRLGVLHWAGPAQMMRFIVFYFLFLGLFLYPFSSFASINNSYDVAMSGCSSTRSGLSTNPGYVVLQDCVVGSTPSGHQAIVFQAQYWNGSSTVTTNPQYFLFDGDPPPNCPAGQVVPAGTQTLYSSTSGEQCRQSDMCQIALKVGGGDSGSLVLTGSMCQASSGPFDPGKPASETSNPDGSTTWCDTNSGTCVTGKPAPPGPPPSSGDTGDNAGNGSTDSSSTTTNGATSSTTTTNTSSTTTSTTNTTTTGGGTSGGGSGDSTSVGTTTGTTIGTQTSTTDTPASSSSTSSKCTTGVCDVGQADGIVGGMYQPSGETPATVYAQFRASVSASPLVSSVSGFFDTAGISGTCPTWHIPGNVYWGLDGFSFDFFCSAGMLQLLALAGMLVLAVGAFSAFRIAIY